LCTSSSLNALTDHFLRPDWYFLTARLCSCMVLENLCVESFFETKKENQFQQDTEQPLKIVHRDLQWAPREARQSDRYYRVCVF